MEGIEKQREFLEKLKEVEKETGMTLMPVLLYNETKGMYPSLKIVELQDNKKQNVPSSKKN